MMQMIEKINILRIVSDHCASLVDATTEQRKDSDFVLFFGVPVIVGTGLIFGGILPNKDLIGILVASLSIFAALLFNLLLLIYDIVRKGNAAQPKQRGKFLQEIYSSIAYSILIAIATIAALLLYFVVTSHLVTSYVVAFFVYSLGLNFILTILMILRRVHDLLSTEFEAKR